MKQNWSAFLMAACLFHGVAGTAGAAWRTLFEVGTDNENYNDLCAHDGVANPPPGSAVLTNDDDTYLAGQYPAPIGTVAADEMGLSLLGVPTLAVTFPMGGQETTKRIHFVLPAAETSGKAQFRLLLDITQPGWVSNNQVQLNGSHDFTVRLNGTVIALLNNITEQGVQVRDIRPPAGLLFTGPNVIEYTRTGGSPGGSVKLDRLSLAINGTAWRDTDGDGLPEWWEEENGLRDQFAADATMDADGDGLTALKEMARGSHPLRADTDGDGLRDNLEPGAPAGSSPVLADSDGDSIPDGQEVSPAAALSGDADGDGSPDSWEMRQGTLPLLPGDGAALLKNVIGLRFNHPSRPGRTMEPYRIGGVVPQLFWNNSRNLLDYNGLTGGTADVASPLPGVLSDGTGTATGVSVNWSGFQMLLSGNSGNFAGRLTDVTLRSSAATPAVIQFSGIPWASYDVYVYAGGIDGRLDSAVRLNNNPASDRWIKVDAQHLIDQFKEAPAMSRPAARRGNYVRFRNVSGAALSISLIQGTDNSAGLSAVQIVANTADRDLDGIPDWYEAQYRLDSTRHDASADPDGDGLNNAGEFARGTDPRLADTDGDGLGDLMETGARVYLNPQRPGTDPLLADTDGDGLSDGDEINGGAFFSHPLLADTDFDGMGDLAERKANSNPSGAAASLRSVPVRDGSTGIWTWQMDGVQIIRDHAAAQPTLSDFAGERLCAFTVRNDASSQFSHAWRFALDQRHDGLHWAVEAGPGSFTETISGNGGLGWQQPGGTATDLNSRLGFSGRGRQDISDRLRFRMDLIPPGTGGVPAALRVRTYNIDRNGDTPVSDNTFSGLTLDPTLLDGTANWLSDTTPRRAGELGVYARNGVSVFFSQARLDETAAFASARDSDNDGLPDFWEASHAQDPFDASDALLDDDLDGLTALAEYEAGTDPGDADSDGDGVLDGAEVFGFSDPLSAANRPFLSTGLTGSAAAGDFNQNGLPDAWEAAFGPPGLPGADPDGDGVSNLVESAAGTDPFNAGSFFRARLLRQGVGNFRLDWPGLRTKGYSVFQSDALGAWAASGLSVQGPDAAGLSYVMPGAPGTGSRKYFRVRVSEKDTDGDGVNDWTENLLGTDPASASSAGSSLPVDADQNGQAESSISGDLARLAEVAGDFQSGTAGVGAAPITPSMASRFLTQASFGPTLTEIGRVRQMGYAAWIQDQIQVQPPYYHSSYLKEIREDLNGPRLGHRYAVNVEALSNDVSPENVHTPFLRAALQKPDQLRQRVAYALSEIFVVSRRDAGLFYQFEGLANFYDILVRHGLGNFRDILLEVTRHPVMGRYLSHLGNQKARPEISQFPDENYAREIMQLFTIGLWELNADGTRKKDSRGADIPTYGNAQITELARVFTGFWYGGQLWGLGGYQSADYVQPMDIHVTRHDFERKQLLRGGFIPARPYSQESALRDVEDAIDSLFRHPNTPPFICRQLIQFLVTSNPPPAYVKRVQDVFVNDGTGTRGNLAAVVTAILLDPEARSSSRLLTSPQAGMLREPLLRFTSLARAFGVGKNEPDLVWWDFALFISVVQQKPLFAPSVFNFFRPDYKPPGPLSQLGLSAPALQLADSNTTISYPNIAWEWICNGIREIGYYQFPLDIAAETALAATPERLLDRLNLLLCQGLMSPATRSAILTAVNRIPADRAATRVRTAIWLSLTSPDGAVLR